MPDAKDVVSLGTCPNCGAYHGSWEPCHPSAQLVRRLVERVRVLDNVVVEHHSASSMREEHHICPVCEAHGGVTFFEENAALYRVLASPPPAVTGAVCALCGEPEDAPQHQPPNRYGRHDFSAASPAVTGEAAQSDLLNLPITGEFAGRYLSVRTASNLANRFRSNVARPGRPTIGEVLAASDDELLRTPNIGPVAVAEVHRLRAAVTGEAMTEEQIADIAKLCDALPPGGMFSEPLRALLREVRRLRASLPSEREGQR